MSLFFQYGHVGLCRPSVEPFSVNCYTAFWTALTRYAGEVVIAGQTVKAGVGNWLSIAHWQSRDLRHQEDDRSALLSCRNGLFATYSEDVE